MVGDYTHIKYGNSSVPVLALWLAAVGCGPEPCGEHQEELVRDGVVVRVGVWRRRVTTMASGHVTIILLSMAWHFVRRVAC